MDPVKSYNLAIKLMSERKLVDAVQEYEGLLKEYPHFEHGNANYDLAGCYEDLGEYAKAEQEYREALATEPSNPIFLGGLAAFTFLHGDPEESLTLHFRLLHKDQTLRDPGKRNAVLDVIRQLAARLGIKTEDLGIP